MDQPSRGATLSRHEHDTLTSTLSQLSLSSPPQPRPRRDPSLDLLHEHAPERAGAPGASTPGATTPSAASPHKPLRRTSSTLSQRATALSPRLTPLQNATSPRQPLSDRRVSSPVIRRKSSASSLHSAAAPPSPITLTPRRSSSSFHPRSPSVLSVSTSQLSTQEEEPPPATAASIASDFFQHQLHSHQESQTDTVVILHDDCYAHRYSRPRTTKSSLSMIVERPERIHASVLGVSAAYVRLGSYHAGGRRPPKRVKNSLEPGDTVANGETSGSGNDAGVPFKIRKSSRSVSIHSPAAISVHGKDWMEELRGMCDLAGSRLVSTGKELGRTTEAGQPEKPKFHEGDLYLCPESLQAFQGALGGVCDAVDAVFSDDPTGPKRAFVAVRPPGHHCSAEFPSGFCWLNNVHIGIEYAAQTYGLTHAVILDFDLHHGDGSQEIAWDRNAKHAKLPKNTPFHKRPMIGYYSMHDINSYPCEWGDREKVQNASLCIDNAHGQSIWNVHLQPWKTESEFWELYETKYSVLLEKARSFLRRNTAHIKTSPKQGLPRAAVFISAGFDASQWEGEGMQRHAVNVPTDFYARFTRDVVSLANEEDIAVDGRIVSVLEGGYSNRALTSGVLSHLSGLCQKSQSREQLLEILQSDGLDLGNMANDTYNGAWWHAENLNVLENHVNPPPPPPAKKPRGGMLPTYATPTTSFAQKVVDPLKLYRSISGTMRPAPVPVAAPDPEVDWIVAAHELSKLLIPTDRETKSCRPEELAAPRRQRENTSSAENQQVEQAGSGRQLRDRKARVPGYVAPASDDDTVPVRPSASSRRQTIADLRTPAPAPIAVPKRVTRRSSNVADLQLVLSSDAAVMPPPQPPAAIKGRKTRAPLAKAPLPTVTATVDRPDPGRAPSLPPSLDGATTAEVPTESPVVPDSQDVDRLTSAVKRITLKVGTREEHDRRQREREEAEKAEKTEAKKKPRKIGFPKSKKTNGDGRVDTRQQIITDYRNPTKTSPASTPPPPAAPKFGSPSLTSPAGTPSPLQQIGGTQLPPLPSGQDVVGDTQPKVSDEQHSSPEEVLSQPSANRIPSASSVDNAALPPLSQQPLDPSPAFAARSMSAAGSVAASSAQPPVPPQNIPQRRELPVWTSTSAIPFSAPLTPKRNASGHGNGVSVSMLARPEHSALDGESDDVEKERDDGGIWEIPETPEL